MNKAPKFDLAVAFHAGVVVITALIFIVIWRVPLLGTLGFESANLFVTICGPLLCLTAALNDKSRLRNYGTIVTKEFLWLFIHIAIFAILLFLNGFSKTSCSNGAGFLPFLVIAIPPLLLNVAMGATIAASIKSKFGKFLIVFFGFLLYYAWILFSWWQEGSFRVLTQASILFSSDLVQGDTLSPAVVGFRASTFLLALAVIMFGINFLGNGKPKMFDTTSRRPFFNIVIIATLLILHSVLAVKSLQFLGKNRGDLLVDYKLLAEKDNLRVFADPMKTTIANANAVLNEARFYKNRIRMRLGAISDAPVTIWLHQSDDDKFLYTGARNVHFALPKHREIQVSGYKIPHDVLGHELAHIYIGEYASTILGYPGFGYLFPNLAITEGLAMVLSRELNVDNGLTMVEQAQALYQANIRLNIKDLFSPNPLAFALANPRASYIYSGATLDFFLSHIDDQDRPARIRELIKVGSLEGLFSTEQEASLAIAAYLKKLTDPVPKYAVSWARRSFPETSILATDCSEKMLSEKAQFHRALINQDYVAAKDVVDRLPNKEQVVVLTKAIDNLLDMQAFEFALRLIKLLEPQISEKNGVQLAEFRLKKLESFVGLSDLTSGAVLLNEIDEDMFSDSSKRLLIALRVYFHSYLNREGKDDLSKSAIAFLFAKPREQLTKVADFAYALSRNDAENELKNPLVNLLSRYLYARFNLRNGRYEQAITFSNMVQSKKNSLPMLIEKETQMMLATSYEALNNHAAALAIYEHLLKGQNTDGEKLNLADLIDRIKFKLENSDT